MNNILSTSISLLIDEEPVLIIVRYFVDSKHTKKLGARTNVETCQFKLFKLWKRFEFKSENFGSRLFFCIF